MQSIAESFIRSQDSIAGTGNSVQMKIEFYNEFGGKHGTSAILNEIVDHDCQRVVAERRVAAA